MVPVQYIISAESSKSAISHVKTALSSGCKWIQLQVEQLSEDKAEKAAKEIKKLCREHDATFIIENNISLVKAVEADGIHITNDMKTSEARQILGEGFLIGANAKSAEEVISNKKQSADYVCCGPFAKIKNGKDDILDIEDLAKIVATVEEQDVTLPLSAFGEICSEDTDSILRTGIRGIMIQIKAEKMTEQLIRDTLNSYLNS